MTSAAREAPTRHDIAAWLIAALLLFLALQLGLLPALLAAGVVVLLTGLMFAIVATVHSEGLPRLLQKMADILDESRSKLPAWLLSTLPSDTDAWRDTVIDWLHEHATELRHWGGEAA